MVCRIGMTYLTDTIIVGRTMDKVLGARHKFYRRGGSLTGRRYAASYPLNIIGALATSTILKRVAESTIGNMVIFSINRSVCKGHGDKY
jgi:hypothetical protein